MNFKFTYEQDKILFFFSWEWSPITAIK